ncbi:hypothetical protein ACIQB5_24470 [Streptomyces sp. NPDC088560]|uniref:hypothetical protein n=1 Tax=Streptomyces sp. NPDC088560 TaxID=3365868 RepID=UPI003800EC42
MIVAAGSVVSAPDGEISSHRVFFGFGRRFPAAVRRKGDEFAAVSRRKTSQITRRTGLKRC